MSSIHTNVYTNVASSDISKFLNYTDDHDVDEDLVTMPQHGGASTYGNQAGVAFRQMRYPSHVSTVVASRLIYLS